MAKRKYIIKGVNIVKCSVCGKVLFAGRAVIRCSCGVYVHSGCWENHVVEAHQPAFVIGKITLDGNFEPRELEATEIVEEVETEIVVEQE